MLASEQDRWHDAVADADEALQEVDEVIHVMDREADDYALLADLMARNDRFIVRVSYDRRVELPDGGAAKLSAALDEVPFVATRTVELSARELAGRRRAGGRIPDANAGMRRCPSVPKPSWSSGPTTPRPRGRGALNSTSSRRWRSRLPKESQPCAGGCCKRDTVDDLLLVVDRYRCRWIVEEYFKALKTGCAYSKRQMESAATLLITLAIHLPIAWHLLLMRHISRHAPDVPALAVVTPTQLRVLEIAVPKWKWSTPPTAE